VNTIIIFQASRFLRLFLLFCVVSFSASQAAQVQTGDFVWHSLGVGGGGNVTGMLFAPGTKDPNLYCRTDVAGIWKYDFTEKLWNPLMTNVDKDEYQSVFAFAIDPANPNLVWAAVGNSSADGKGVVSIGHTAILKTEDGGKKWQEIKNGFYIAGNGENRTTGTERMLVDPNNSSVIYFCTEQEGLQITYDGGKSWKELSGDAAGQLPRGPKGRGEAWIIADNAQGATDVDGTTVSKVLYVGIAFDGIYRSDDGGSQWQRISDSLKEPNVGWDKKIPTGATIDPKGVLYVSFTALPGGQGDPNSLLSYEQGKWTILPSKGWMQRGDVEVIPTDPPITLSTPEVGDFTYRSLMGMYNGSPYVQIFSAENGKYFQSTGWEDKKMRTNVWMMPDRAICYNPSNPKEVWIAAGLTIWKTDDVTGGGDPAHTIWKTASTGLAETVDNQVRSLPAKGGLKTGRIATAVDDLGGFVYKNLDDLDTTPKSDSEFQRTLPDGKIDTGLHCTACLDFEENDPSNMVRSADNFVALDQNFSGYSNDGGITWKKFAAFPQRAKGGGNAFAGRIAVARNNASEIVWAPWGEPVYCSKDGGSTWKQAVDADNKPITNVARPFSFWDAGINNSLSADPNADDTFYALPMASGKLLRSSDGGATWSVASDLGNADQWPGLSRKDWLRAFLSFVPGSPGEIWITLQEAPGNNTMSGGLWHSTDGRKFSKIDNVSFARAVANGAPMTGSSTPTLYMIGTVNGQGDGIYRSDDGAKTWTKLLATGVDEVGRFLFTRFAWLDADRNVPGLVYISTQGYGTWYCRSAGGEKTSDTVTSVSN
jgi:photosystem II stability/assembly factor-like uncharacterized protein